MSVSSSARDGVEKLGAIIDQYGSQDCNQIVIADNTETWIFAQLSGHQWIAVKMGDDVASVNPNIGGLQYKVNLDDASQCLHSAGVVTLPESNGVLVTYDDGMPNIFKTYGKENSGSSQNTRWPRDVLTSVLPLRLRRTIPLMNRVASPRSSTRS